MARTLWTITLFLLLAASALALDYRFPLGNLNAYGNNLTNATLVSGTTGTFTTVNILSPPTSCSNYSNYFMTYSNGSTTTCSPVNTSAIFTALSLNNLSYNGSMSYGYMPFYQNSTHLAYSGVQANGSAIAINTNPQSNYELYILDSAADAKIAVYASASGKAAFIDLINGPNIASYTGYKIGNLSQSYGAFGRFYGDSATSVYTATDTTSSAGRAASFSGNETTLYGVSTDGSGKVVCVKADGALGSCSSVVGAGGTCTCG